MVCIQFYNTYTKTKLQVETLTQPKSVPTCIKLQLLLHTNKKTPIYTYHKGRPFTVYIDYVKQWTVSRHMGPSKQPLTGLGLTEDKEGRTSSKHPGG